MFFFFKAAATTEIYTLSLHDALPICAPTRNGQRFRVMTLDTLFYGIKGSSYTAFPFFVVRHKDGARRRTRSEEHTSELQSQSNLVCRLLLEKKKKNKGIYI